MTDDSPENFEWHEFDSPDKPGSGQANMHPTTVAKLVKARIIAGLVFALTSAYRTPAHNRDIGGVEGSAHTNGRAIDIDVAGYSRAEINRIIVALVLAGFLRIGESEDGLFLHADDDPTKPADEHGIATWDYDDPDEHKA